MLKIFKRLHCKHPNRKFIRNLHGDEANYYNARSIWRCNDCNKIIYDDNPYTNFLDNVDPILLWDYKK